MELNIIEIREKLKEAIENDDGFKIEMRYVGSEGRLNHYSCVERYIAKKDLYEELVEINKKHEESVQEQREIILRLKKNEKAIAQKSILQFLSWRKKYK